MPLAHEKGRCMRIRSSRMKDILHTETWRRWILTAILYAFFSVLPALLILRFVIRIEFAILMAVLVCQAVSFIIFRRKFHATAARMVTAVCVLFEASRGEIDTAENQKVSEVIFNKEDIHNLSFLMLWFSAATSVVVDALLPWAIELQFPLADLWKLIGCIIALYVTHEALHGLAALTSARVPIRSLHFGINWRLGALYCHADRPMKVCAFRVFAVLPMIVTTPVAGLVLLWDPAIWSVLLLSVTFAGCAGDVMVLLRARRYDNDRWIQDHPSEVGFIIFPAGETPAL